MSTSQRTFDDMPIGQWVETRGAKPARVPGTGGDSAATLLRIDFPETLESDDERDEVTGEEFDRFVQP